MAAKITESTIIDVGMQLSKNFNLSHLTSGAYHPVAAKWLPLYSSILIPDSSMKMNLTGGVNLPLWKIVSNLQTGAEGLLENLVDGFGGDLIIRSGFLNNIPVNALANEISHISGMSFDIQIAGISNMYGVAKEIQKLSKTASELNLVFGGGTSWMHMTVDPLKVASSLSNLVEPLITTSDLITGITETGLTSIRGFI